MVPKEKKIVAILEELYPEPPIPLVHTDPYTLLIAVLLSARCTDARVNSITPKLFALANTPELMAEQEISQVQEIIRPCGLSLRKATAIIELSKILVSKYKGKVPDSFDALEELPGIGHKTASVVMAQAFSRPAFPVDTHILRLARRWGYTLSKSPEQAEKALKKAFPKKYWIKMHLQMIYYGRNYCRAWGHNIEKCPICRIASGR